MTRLGFIGLGTMGSRLARRLLDAGYQVSGYNRTPRKAEDLVKAGLHLCASPREVAQTADITFSMVADSAALSAITDGPDGILAGLSTGKIYVDMSTVSPRLTRDLAARVAATGAQMLDAPVSGSVSAAESGTLIYFVGGDTDAQARLRPMLDKMGQKIIPIGGSGQAITIKISINLGLATQLIALFEGVLLAERSGISRQVALDALLNSAAASPAMKYRAPFILKMPDVVWFNVEMMLKDLRIAKELGEELGVPLRGVDFSIAMLQKAIEMGYGEQDFAALYKVLAHDAGMPD